MADGYEIDFIKIKTKKSGDAIVIRTTINDIPSIQIVDGGYLDTGDDVVTHIHDYYGSNASIDSVLLTHPDADHAGGLRKVLAELSVKSLWMLRPWDYADELLPQFENYTSRDRLISKLKSTYSNVVALDELATEHDIPVYAPFAGSQVGRFVVLSPSKQFYLDQILASEKTPAATTIAAATGLSRLAGLGQALVESAFRLITDAWGIERFPSTNTSADNEMSVVQYAEIDNQKILLTGDVGRQGLEASVNKLKSMGVSLPGFTVFQLPHHGSSKNVNTELLNELLGMPHADQNASTFSAVVSCSSDDDRHPRKAVVRAAIHRGARVVTNESDTVCSQHNADSRGWAAAVPLDYPHEQEDE